MSAAEQATTGIGRKKLLLAGGILLLGLLTGYQFYRAGAVQVETSQVVVGTIVTTVEETGYVQADEEYDILAPVSGYIGNLAVARGQTVVRSQPLMVMDSPETNLLRESSRESVNRVAAELENARNNRQTASYELADAEKRLVKDNRLVRAETISQQQFDRTKLEVDRLRSRVSSSGEIIVSMERQLAALKRQQDAADRKADQLIIKSPSSGTVLYLLPKAGELVVTGTVVARIGKSGTPKVNVDILSDSMGQVRLGQTVTISSPVLSSSITGSISSIYPQAVEKISALGVIQRRVRVIADLEKAEKLKSGYEVKVTIATQSRDHALIIPREAVVMNPQGIYEVWIVTKDHRAESRRVKIGLMNRKQVEVIEGLRQGDTVITNSKGTLGDRVRVRVTTSDTKRS
jgi:HlyD family secretion protein